MKLTVLLPTRKLLDEEVAKVVAEAIDGSFGMLPKHVDFVAPLSPGLLMYETLAGDERFVAVDEGVLVKKAEEVLVSTTQAALGADLGRLRELVESQFEASEGRERLTRSALARLEANLVRRFMDLGK